MVRALCLAVALAAMAPGSQQPIESSGTPDARAAFDAGRQAQRDGDNAKAAALFRKAVDLDPRFVDAHEQFIFTTEQAALAYDPAKGHGNTAAEKQATADLTTLYEGWAKAHPENPIYEWALATLAGKDWNAEERHLKRAIELAPTFARAYQDLSLIAELRGDNAGRIADLKKASDLNPKDPSYFFYYANAVFSANHAEGLRLEQQVATRFPNTERGAQALYWAAYDTTDDAARKIAIYERLRKEFPPEKFEWSESGMSDYFDVLIATDPAKARALAADMLERVTAKSEKKSWTDLAAYADALTQAAALRARGDGKGAVARLMTVKEPPSYRDPAPLALARAASTRAAGDPQSAFEGLAAVIARAPSDEMIAALHSIGRSLHKSPNDVDAYVRQLREEKSKPAAPFTLPDYPDGRKVSLSDYRGKVVLINFWYPSCGPCRGEFPTLQRVLDKYKDRGFIILSLNVLPEEHDFVMPYLTRNGFGFKPLETTTDWAEKTYGARGYPTNFLVDREGRIIFKPGIIRSPREQRSFELQIESLLK